MVPASESRGDSRPTTPSPTLDIVDLAAVSAAFGQRLHAAGLPVTPERAGWLARTIALARPATTRELYWLARATLVMGHDQLELFDAVFAQVFGGIVDDAFRGDTNVPSTLAQANLVPGRERGPSAARPIPGSTPADHEQPLMRSGAVDDDAAADDEQRRDVVLAASSATEQLRAKDFGDCTPDELARLAVLMAALIPSPPRRTSRRLVRHRAGSRIDLRSTLRRAQRTGGDPVRQVRRRHGERHRRVVLLADVSGSMQSYTRAYLYLLHGAVRAIRAEAFLFATRLTRATRPLRVSSPEVALRRATRAADDFAGGTRIGETLKAFNDGWGRRGIARGAVVVIVSDGWNAGDPALVGEQMARLARLAHRIVWVNPRKAAARYEPAVAAMAAALPYVDAFVSGHSLDALLDVAAALAG